MIKRLLIFLALLGAGFFVLFTLVEERNRPSINSTEPETQTGPGIKVREMEVRPSGPLHIPVKREVQISSDRMKLLLVYDLHAEDSEPRPNNTQLLKGVRVDFYEVDDTAADDEPRAMRTSWMTADRAILELSQDEDGRVKVAEDKQMEFWGVKFMTSPDASIPNAEIAIEHAIAVNGVDEIRLWTPSDDVPVSVLTRGPDSFKVNGLGIRTYVPAHRGRKGKVAIQRQGVFRFTIASHPVLLRGNAILKSRGPLEYQEDMAAGVATVSMSDDVELRAKTTGGGLDRFGGTKRPDTTVDLVARGRRLDAVLTRSAPEGKPGKPGKQRDTAMVWTRIILLGGPVSLEGNDLRLTCDRVDVLPDLAGDPYWITASGSANQPTMFLDRPQTKITATSYIHLIRPLRKQLALLSSYGLPEAAMPKDYGQLAIFEGPATVTATQDGITATATGGLLATRTDADSPNGEQPTPTTFFGKGNVHLHSPEWIVDGNDGFRLREIPTAGSKTPAVNRFLRLGPDGAGPAHAYRIERLPSAKNTAATTTTTMTGVTNGERLVTTGTGACHLTLEADGNGNLRLDSQNKDIRILMGEDRGELQRAASLGLRFHDKVGVLGLIATGQDCPLRFQMESTGWVVGHAAEIHVPAPGVLHLVGRPRCRVHQEKPMRVIEGREIVFQRLDEKAGLLHCTGDARIRMRQRQQEATNTDSRQHFAPSGDQDVELLANDIRVFPYLETRNGWSVHTRGLPPFARSLLAYGHRSPYLFATGNVRLIQRDTNDGGGDKVIGRGFGDHLVLRFDSAARSVDGRLNGKHAKLIRIDRNGATHTAEARIIRFANDPHGEHLDLLAVGDFDPRVSLPSSSSSSSSSPDATDSGSTLVICKGHIAITPDKVRFLGPMEAQALDRNGEVDPSGLHVTAASMLMNRDPETGEVTHVQASRDIDFRVRDMVGEADEMSIDLRDTLIIARGDDRPAVLRQTNGRIFKAAQVNYNYRTRQTQSWNGRVVQATTPTTTPK